jgi:4-amino-4-deoxy-L-arabinose transferase-like glycosyltransferase
MDPEVATTPGRDGPNRLPGIYLILLLLAAGHLFFSRLDCPLQEPEEPRYAEIPRQMLAEGSFAVPVLNGQPYYDKPPLLYWLVMAAYRLFGVDDWTARLVASGAGFLTVLLTSFWGRRVVGPRAGFCGALILCLSPRFLYLSRLLTTNGLLCLCVVAALAAAHLAVCGTRLGWRWWLLSAAACGLGLLAKGPVTLLLVAVPVFVYQRWGQGAVRPQWRPWLAYLVVVLVLAGPWFVLLSIRDPEFLGYFFWKHHVTRFVAPFDHAKPVWYYTADVGLGMLPGTVLLLPLGWSLCQRRPRPPLGFFLLAAGWCFVFYSSAGSKRAGYILPAMPPLALALGSFLDAALTTAGERRWLAVLCRGVSVATFAMLLAAVYWLLPGHASNYALREQLRPLVEASRDPQMPIVCYPRGWDSVSFYLRRKDVRVYTADRRQEFLADLQAHPWALAIIKSERPGEELLPELRAQLEFVPTGRQGPVAVGRIRPASDVRPTR